MTSAARALSSRGERLVLAALALLPLAVYLAARFLGYTKFLRLGAVAVAALVFGMTLFVRPRWGLFFLVFYIYSGVGSWLPVNVALPVSFIVTGAVLLQLVRGGQNRLVDASFWCAVAFFLLFCLQSMLVAPAPMLSVVELANFAKMLLVVYLIVQLVRTADDLRRLAYVVFAGAVATVVLGAAGLYLGIGPAQDNFIGGVFVLRFTGAHENPNRAAAYMCSALPLGLFGARNSREPWLRAAFIAGVILLIIGIFSTFSRSVVVPFAAIALAVLVREVHSKRSWVFLLLLTVAGIVLTPRYYWDRVMALRDVASGSQKDWSVYTRWLAMTTAWELFLKHPLTGVGLGNFIVAGAYKVFLRIVAHNTYLEILVGTGIFGLTTFLWILAAGIRSAVAGARHHWASQPAWVRSLCFYVALSAVSIWLSALFGSMPFRYPLWIPVAASLVVGNLLRSDRAQAAA
ncbi:MAG: O-antigen ligase family protein [Candidatus Krumholzibacteria bacterium]|nr:O-antigen ligase family protein [Candidatus Krumholzibacteria bacterium]MDH4335937.1 O-antigen ligase family protein [Candidatus Krumholzibacteria bacterium]